MRGWQMAGKGETKGWGVNRAGIRVVSAPSMPKPGKFSEDNIEQIVKNLLARLDSLNDGRESPAAAQGEIFAGGSNPGPSRVRPTSLPRLGPRCPYCGLEEGSNTVHPTADQLVGGVVVGLHEAGYRTVARELGGAALRRVGINALRLWRLSGEGKTTVCCVISD